MTTTLEWNGRAVGWLRDAVNNCNLNHVPQSIKKIIKTGAWRERYETMRVFKFETFSDFITKMPVEGGCGWEPKLVEGLLLKANDVEALTMWREAITAPVGIHHDSSIRTIRGTSRAYTLVRLKNEKPELFKAVVAGKMSANAAAIEAGIRSKLTHFDRIARLIRKLTTTECADLIARIEARMRELYRDA